MTASIRSYRAIYGGSSSTLYAPCPSGTRSGDLLLAFVQWNSVSSSLTPASGWTSQLLQRNNVLRSISVEVFSKIATPSDEQLAGTDQAYGFRISSGTPPYLSQTISIRSYDSQAPIDVKNSVASGTSTSTITMPPITTTGPDRLIINFAGQTYDSQSYSWDRPTQLTSIYWSNRSHSTHYMTMAQAGSVPQAVATASSGPNSMVGISLAVSPYIPPPITGVSTVGYIPIRTS